MHVPCSFDAECAKFDSDQGKFVCQLDRGQCSSPDAYRGARCYDDADCTRDEGTSCVFSSMPTTAADQGTCSRLCATDGTCTPRGGFGHVCLGFTVGRDGMSKPGCYPGYFGLPCTLTDNCVATWSPRAGTSPTICTTFCQTDADCDNNRWTAGSQFWHGSICVPLRGREQPASGASPETARGGVPVIRFRPPAAPVLGPAC